MTQFFPWLPETKGMPQKELHREINYPQYLYTTDNISWGLKSRVGGYGNRPIHTYSCVLGYSLRVLYPWFSWVTLYTSRPSISAWDHLAEFDQWTINGYNGYPDCWPLLAYPSKGCMLEADVWVGCHGYCTMMEGEVGVCSDAGGSHLASSFNELSIRQKAGKYIPGVRTFSTDCPDSYTL